MRKILTIIKNILIIAGFVYGLYVVGSFDNNRITFARAVIGLLCSYLMLGVGYAVKFIKLIIE